MVVHTRKQALGSGAFAEVRLCFHRRTGAKYAAKIVDKNKFALNKELRKVWLVVSFALCS